MAAQQVAATDQPLTYSVMAQTAVDAAKQNGLAPFTELELEKICTNVDEGFNRRLKYKIKKLVTRQCVSLAYAWHALPMYA